MRSMSVSCTSLPLATRPSLPMDDILIAFCSTSSKLRPMAITSPTDFMALPSLRFTSSNLLKSHRGIFSTQ